jgi:hypothetical protein
LWKVEDEPPYTRACRLRKRATCILGHNIDDLTYSGNDISLDICKLAHTLLRDEGIRVERKW